MLTVTLRKEETKLYEIIKEWNFFDYTYSELCTILDLKKPQCVLNKINSLENKWMITLVRGIKKRKQKWFTDIIVHNTPRIEVIYT